MAELKKLSELKYYFNPPYYVFAAGAKTAFLGKYPTVLTHPVEEDGDEIWVAVGDLARLLSPEMSLQREGDELVFADETCCLRIAEDTGMCRVIGADPVDSLTARRAGGRVAASGVPGDAGGLWPPGGKAVSLVCVRPYRRRTGLWPPSGITLP